MWFRLRCYVQQNQGSKTPPLPRTNRINTSPTPAAPSSQLQPTCLAPPLPTTFTYVTDHAAAYYAPLAGYITHTMSSPAQPSPQVLQAYQQRLETLYQSLPDLLTTEQEDRTGIEALEQDVSKLDVKEQNLQDRANKYCQEFLYIGGPTPHKQDLTST